MPLYSLLIITGLIVGNFFVYRDIKRRGQDFDDFILIETYGLAFGFLGAKLLYILVSINDIDWSRIGEWQYLFAILKGGFVFYGGLIGGILGVLIAKRIHKIDIKKYLSELVYGIPIVHGFGRLGCYHAGCCYGMPYNGPFNIVYKDIPNTLCGVPLFPVQLLEALCLFILAFIFYMMIKKKGPSMEFFFGYIMSYSVIRFFLEFLRYDAVRGRIGAFSTSQWISIMIFISILVRCFIVRYRKCTNCLKQI